MKFEIMVAILFELLSKRSVTAPYLAEKYEVSKRSIYRYIDALDRAGVPVYTTRGVGGGYSLVDTYRISSTYLTTKEFEQVISALKGINSGVDNIHIEKAIVKLQAVSRKEYSGFSIKSGNLIIDGGHWGDTVGYKNKLKIIQKCIDENLQLSIKYHDRNGSITERIIEPHVVLFKQGLWYVYAYCNLRNKFRFFKTGRIEEATVLTTKFERQEVALNDIPLDFWNNSTETCEVEMEISTEVLSDVEEWLGIEHIEKLDGKFKACVKLPNDEGLVNKIMGFGKGIKILSPKTLVKKVQNNAKELLKNYV